jgi:hypothetical protein
MIAFPVVSPEYAAAVLHPLDAATICVIRVGCILDAPKLQRPLD